MKSDTPLPEVALHLPAEAARALGDCNPIVQELVLTNVRSFLVIVEDKGVELDVLQSEAVLSAFVASQIKSAKDATELHYRLQQAFQMAQDIAAMTRMQP